MVYLVGRALAGFSEHVIYRLQSIHGSCCSMQFSSILGVSNFDLVSLLIDICVPHLRQTPIGILIH